MKIEENYSIKDINSLRINQLAKYFCSIETGEQFLEAIEFSRLKSLPVLFIGEGSNIVFTKDYDGLVIKNNIFGINNLTIFLYQFIFRNFFFQ